MQDKEDRLRRLVREAAGPAEPSAPAVRIEGSHNIVGHGNTVIHAPVVRPRIVVPPPPGSITPAQAATIKQLLAEWVTVHNRIKKRPLTWGAAWQRFKKKFNVHSYLALPEERFDEACAWLRQQRAILDGMATAPRKDPAWRARQIAYIKARCKNQLGDERCYQPYIERTFGKTSLSDLDEAELARTKSYIAHKKAP
jgi:hypothetical protein